MLSLASNQRAIVLKTCSLQARQQSIGVWLIKMKRWSFSLLQASVGARLVAVAPLLLLVWLLVDWALG